MPLILPSQEAEIRKIVVRSKPRQIVCKTLISKNPSQIKFWGEWAQGVSSEFMLQYYKKTKQTNST
jgi:hypothetical protein